MRNEGNEGDGNSVRATVSNPAPGIQPSRERFISTPPVNRLAPSPPGAPPRMSPPPSAAPGYDEWTGTGSSTAFLSWSRATLIGRSGKALVAVALVLAVAATSAAVTWKVERSSPQRPSSFSADQSFSLPIETTGQISRRLIPAIVDINTVNQTDTGYALSAATGMIVSSDGVIVTNNHVVEEATSITVRFCGGHIRPHKAVFLGADPAADVAVIRVEGLSGLPTVPLAISAGVVADERVVAIGNAHGRDGRPTVTSGRVEFLDRSVSASDAITSAPEHLSGLIEASSHVWPGNSGGPLVDDHGQVIGMNTAANESGDSYAIPIAQVAAIVSAIDHDRTATGVVIGLRAFLGVVGQSAPGSGGVAVTRVVLGDPAAVAGIEPGDTILAFDSHPVGGVSRLQALLGQCRSGELASVTVREPVGTRTVFVKLVAGPAP